MQTVLLQKTVITNEETLCYQYKPMKKPHMGRCCFAKTEENKNDKIHAHCTF